MANPAICQRTGRSRLTEKSLELVMALYYATL
jgi:hypothetical protein